MKYIDNLLLYVIYFITHVISYKNLHQNRKEFIKVYSINNIKSNQMIKYNNSTINTLELTKLLDSMPNDEKYSFIIQSYASKIINEGTSEKKTNKKQKYFDVINKLYNEMINVNVIPDIKTTQYFIDSSVIFCDCDKLGSTFQLAKSGGLLKVFGGAIGSISNPVFSSTSRLAVDIRVPDDNREEEVFYAGMVFSGGFVYTILQIIGSFNEELKQWAGVSTIIIGLAIAFDITIRQTKGLKLSLDGFDRLLLSDSDRQVQCDSAALLTGYLLGLPCFCFQPDVAEALKMLSNNINSLLVYKQTKATNINKRIKSNLIIDDSVNKLINIDDNSYDVNQSYIINNFNEITPDIIDLSLGRVLIWMMAPVAVESLKYGKTIHSDPRRPNRLLSVLNNIQNNNILTINNNILKSETTNCVYNIPNDINDKQALLNWAYYEAVQLIRRYGDLIEDIKVYMKTGTASVGECVLLIENELKG